MTGTARRAIGGLALLLQAAGIGAAPPPIAVEDGDGRPVVLTAPAQRIVTLSPHATELVFAAGAGERLVAVAAYSDFPPAARTLPRIGGAAGLDRERLLALRPDLVVAWSSGNRPGDLAWLSSVGVPVYRSEPHRLAEIAGEIRDLGRLTGNGAVAEGRAMAFLSRLDRACPGARPHEPGLYLLWDRPLMTVGGGHWISEAMARAGLHNVFADRPEAVLSVTPEALVARRPAVILLPGVEAPRVAGLLAPHRRIAIDPALWARPTPRLVRGIERLCRALRETGTGQ